MKKCKYFLKYFKGNENHCDNICYYAHKKDSVNPLILEFMMAIKDAKEGYK